MTRLSSLSSMAMAVALAVASLRAGEVRAQSVANRIDGVRNGSVEFTFPTRPGVCGDGHGSIWTRGRGDRFYVDGHRSTCIAGPIRVTIGKSDGEIVSVRTCVGCALRATAGDEVNLGSVDAPEAARYLIRLASTLGGTNTSEAIAAATFADGVDLTPELTALVRNDDATIAARKDGLFWLGQSDARTQDLVSLYSTLKPLTLREHFTFVLSQRHDDDVALDKLMDLAQHDADVQVRKQAMFWLGQSKDPKAIKFFHTILTR